MFYVKRGACTAPAVPALLQPTRSLMSTCIGWIGEPREPYKLLHEDNFWLAMKLLLTKTPDNESFCESPEYKDAKKKYIHLFGEDAWEDGNSELQSAFPQGGEGTVPTAGDILKELETSNFGTPKQGGLIPRIVALETQEFGAPQQGNPRERIQALRAHFETHYGA